MTRLADALRSRAKGLEVQLRRHDRQVEAASPYTLAGRQRRVEAETRLATWLRGMATGQANLRRGSDGAFLGMLGIRASSTAGLAAAARAWIAKARAAADAAEREPARGSEAGTFDPPAAEETTQCAP